MSRKSTKHDRTRWNDWNGQLSMNKYGLHEASSCVQKSCYYWTQWYGSSDKNDDLILADDSG